MRTLPTEESHELIRENVKTTFYNFKVIQE